MLAQGCVGMVKLPSFFACPGWARRCFQSSLDLSRPWQREAAFSSGLTLELLSHGARGPERWAGRGSWATHRFMLRWLRRRRFLLIALAPVAALLWVIGDTFFEDDNFRVVTPDLYRAGQLRSDEWSESFEEHHYRSVINLRGGRPLKAWYKLERSFADEHGLTHFDFGISDKVEPSFDTMKQLVALMRAAPKPVLIHCQAGSDRSGLAAALYLYAIEGRPLSEASGQLSLWYGHFPWLMSQTGAMDRALEAFSAPHPDWWLRSTSEAASLSTDDGTSLLPNLGGRTSHRQSSLVRPSFPER